MPVKLKKKSALGAAPAKTGEPEEPKKKSSKTADVVDIAQDNSIGSMSTTELANVISANVVHTLANVFSALSENLEAGEDPDSEEEVGEPDTEEDEAPVSKKGKGKKAKAAAEEEEEDEEEDAPVSKKGKGKKAKAAPVEEEEEPDTEDEEVGYDPDPFRDDTLEKAEELAEEYDNSVKEKKEILKNYIENAPPDAPATIKIAKLVEGKKLDKAWIHLLALLIDDNGDAHGFEDAYMRGEEFLYLGGVEAVPVEDTGFVPVKKAKLINLEDGTESKPPKDMEFAQILHNPVQDTYFGLNEDQDSVVEVEAE